MQNKTPFRTVLGEDQNGYYLIKLGHTVYAVKDEQVFTVYNDKYKVVPVETLNEKLWIMRNINEVLKPKSPAVINASYLYKNGSGYHIKLNDVIYVADVDTHYTEGLDKMFMGGARSTKHFGWHLLKKLVDGELQPVDVNEFTDPSIRRAFKGALNYQRKIDLMNGLAPKWHSRHECLEYNNNKYNTDAFGNKH